jgi:hypothetical protein
MRMSNAVVICMVLISFSNYMYNTWSRKKNYNRTSNVYVKKHSSKTCANGISKRVTQKSRKQQIQISNAAKA